MRQSIIPKLALILAFTSGLAPAGEYAVLKTGFLLRAERHVVEGSQVRLFTQGGGEIVLDASQIQSFEVEDADKNVPPLPPAPKTAPTTHDLITAAARKHGLPPELVHSVVASESAYRPDAVSSAGAIGLMQLMPSTAKAYGADPTDPQQNVNAGTAYLRDLLLKYAKDDSQVRRALAAYNAGPGAVAKYNGVPPYRETQTYVERVLRKFKQASSFKTGTSPQR